MHTIFRSIKRGHHRSTAYQRALLEPYDVTPARYEMLFVIEQHCFKLMRQSELTKKLGVSRMTVSRMVRGLEKQGYVERRPSPFDRRGIVVRLTPAGRALMRTIHRALIARGVVWMALYTILGPDGRGPGALKYHLDALARGFRDDSRFIWRWCKRTIYPERYRHRLPPPFEWPEVRSAPAIGSGSA